MVKNIVLLLFYSVSVAVLGVNSKWFTVNNGLSINETTCLFQDSQMQYLWIGTQNGLNRFNGHDFKSIYIQRKNSRANSFINDLAEDGHNNLWIATNSGLACYNYHNDTWVTLPSGLDTGLFRIVCKLNDSIVVGVKDRSTLVVINVNNDSDSYVLDLIDLVQINDVCSVNREFLISSANGLYSYNHASKKVVLIDRRSMKSYGRMVYFENDAALWFKNGGKWFRVPVVGGDFRLKDAEVLNGLSNLSGTNIPRIDDVAFDGKTYWFASENGLLAMDKFSHKIVRDSVLNGFSDISINNLLFDNSGNLWCGTWQSGICKIADNACVFNTYHKSTVSGVGLPSRLVRGFLQLDDHNVAVATETTGLVVFNTATGAFSSAETKFGTFAVAGNVMHVIKRDWKGRIWAGYHKDWFNVIYGPGKEGVNAQIRQIRTRLRYPGCNDLLIDEVHKKIFIATGNEVLMYDDAKGEFSNFATLHNPVSALFLGSDQNLWIGTRLGIEIRNIVTDKPDNTLMTELAKSNLSGSKIASIVADSKGNVWVGTYGDGLYVFDKILRTFKCVEPPLHLCFKVVYSIVEDNAGLMWFGTNNGLFVYNPFVNAFKRFGIEDGIQDNQFNYNSVLKLADGALFFGGISGFTWFYPNRIENLPKLATPRFSGMVVGSQNIPIYKQGVLQPKVKVPFTSNSFEISFFSPDFTSSDNFVYAYKLVGYSNRMQYCLPNMPVAIFTNVPPGKYRLEVMVTRPNSDWSELAVSPEIVVLPPWYRTTFAYLIYLLLIVSGIIFSNRLTKQQANYKNSLEIARLEKEKSEEVSGAKLSFFTEIAHEIRTPLTLIVGPLNDLLSTRKFDDQLKKSLQLMHKSAHNLLLLMDELLLFRKAESGKLPLLLKSHDFKSLVNQWSTVFSPELKRKQLSLVLPLNNEPFTVVFDSVKMEKVFSNLLNNAIKFTPDSGVISVGWEKLQNGFCFTVADNGVGIPASECNKVFDRFYQSDGLSGNGFGIGLTLSKRIVEAHGGTISVESTINKGSVFTVFIPLLQNNVQVITEPSKSVPVVDNPVQPENSNIKVAMRGHLLVVEDNEDVANYIAGVFEPEFDVTVKRDGVEGFNFAIKHFPDIIVTDLQMPRMNGVVMCKKLKQNVATSHIPVVLLSAFNEIEDQINGFNVGADDYIGKPFDSHILLRKISNIIQTRKQLIKSYQTGSQIENLALHNTDQRFLERVNHAIYAELANDKFDVPALCQMVSISKTGLNHKLTSILGVSPAQYIRKVKLKEGFRLISEEGYNVNEAAFAIGFSPAYFATCFKKEFGVSPGKL